jgi:hypothetical protein
MTKFIYKDQDKFEDKIINFNILIQKNGFPLQSLPQILWSSIKIIHVFRLL